MEFQDIINTLPHPTVMVLKKQRGSLVSVGWRWSAYLAESFQLQKVRLALCRNSNFTSLCSAMAALPPYVHGTAYSVTKRNSADLQWTFHCVISSPPLSSLYSQTSRSTTLCSFPTWHILWGPDLYFPWYNPPFSICYAKAFAFSAQLWSNVFQNYFPVSTWYFTRYLF